MVFHLSYRVRMGGIRELLDRKIWEWDLSFRWEWEWDGNGNEVIEMGGNWYEKSIPARLKSKFYQNGYTDSAYSWHEGILRRISYLYYYKKIRVSPKN